MVVLSLGFSFSIGSPILNHGYSFVKVKNGFVHTCFAAQELRPLAARERQEASASREISPKELTAKMLQGHIDIDNDLPDSAARKALTMLRKTGVPSAVLGGVIRDLILGSPKAEGEADILLRIDTSSIRAEDNYQRDEERVKLMLEALDRFARALEQSGVKITGEQLMSGAPAIKIGGVMLDFLGFVDSDGKVWGKPGYDFANFPEFSINRVIVTTQGDVLDTYQGVNDGIGSTLRLVGGEEGNISHQVILRGIRFLLQYPDMRMSPETEKIIFGFFDSERGRIYREYVRNVNEVTDILRKTDKMIWGLRQGRFTQWLVKHAVAYGRRRLYRWVVKNNPPYIAYRSHEAGYLTEYERYFGIDGRTMVNYSLLSSDDPVRKESFSKIIDGVVGYKYFSTRIRVDISGSKAISRTDLSGIGSLVGDIYRVASRPHQATAMIRRAGLEEFLRVCGLNLNQIEEQVNGLAQARAAIGIDRNI